MKRKYQVKAIVPATVVKSFEVEATSEAEALALYLQGEAYLVQNETTSYDDDVEFRIEEI
jgi:calcineurin-like phosphoesterase